LKDKVDSEVISIQYQLTKPIFYDNINFKKYNAIILPEHSTLIEFKFNRSIITMKEMEFINNITRGFYNIDIPEKIKGSIYMGYKSNINKFYHDQKELISNLLGPGS